MTRGLADVVETERRHSAKCREQDVQRQREAEALQAGVELGKAALKARDTRICELMEALMLAHEFACNVDVQGDWWDKQRSDLCDRLQALLDRMAQQ